MSELDGRLGPTWCRRRICPSGSQWVLMYDLQREHKKDILCRLPISRPGPTRKRAPRDIRFSPHTLTQSTSQACRRNRPPKSKSSSRSARHLTIQSSVDQMESRLDVARGQRHGGVEWIPEKNFPSSCALSSDQLQSQFRHSWCPVREVGHDQSRLPAFHVFKQLLPGCRGFSKSYQDHHH